jgi:hypothetical protein
MADTLDNLETGDQQSLLASDGTAVTATPDADGEMAFLDADGNPATKEDGTEYTEADMAAMVVSFSEESS